VSILLSLGEEINLVWWLEELPLLDIEDAAHDLLSNLLEALRSNKHGNRLSADIFPSVA
jgi:hypothetical protein